MNNQYSKSLKEFVREIDQTDQKINQISILNKSNNIAQYKWKEPKKQNMHSIAKSFVSLAVGFAIEEGLLSLNDTVAKFFPEKVTNENINILSNLTLHHLLTLSVGQDSSYLMLGSRNELTETDWIDYCLKQPFIESAGEEFLYSNVGPYLAGCIVERQSGKDLISYLGPRFLDPLEFSDIYWERDPMGHTFGAGGIFMTPNDLGKFAQLYLNNGCWMGEQIVSPDWIRLSSKPHINVDKNNPNATHYGYGFWINAIEDYYRADGAFGQIAQVYPKKELAVIVNSSQSDNDKILEKISRLIYPIL